MGSGPSEVVALRARVAELEACARRPLQNSEDAAQNIRAKVAKRRLGTCSEDVVPSTDQQLSEWLDGMNCEFLDALDVGDMESASHNVEWSDFERSREKGEFGSPFHCRQHGAVRRVTLWGMRGVRVGRLPTPVLVVSHGGPRSITGLGVAVPVERLVERKIPCFDAFGRAIASHASVLAVAAQPTARLRFRSQPSGWVVGW